MKRKNITLTLLALLGLFTMQSCKEDGGEYTTVHTYPVPVGSVTPAVRADGTVFITGSTVELSWTGSSTGEAQTWDVYFGDTKTPELYKTGYTDQKITVPVVDNGKYWWRVETIDSKGVVTTSPTYKFIAINGSNTKFAVSLSCNTNVKSLIGMDLPADKVVDLTLLILNKSDRKVVELVAGDKYGLIDDAASSEVFRGWPSLPDGDYYVGIDINYKYTFGSYDQPVDLDLTLKFEQLGMINETYQFPAVMTDLCIGPKYRAILVEVNKKGSVYTLTKALHFRYDDVVVPDQFAGTWKGTDATYPSQIIGTLSAGKIISLDNLCAGWIADFWGEEIISHSPVKLVYNYTNGTLTIPSQVSITTKYKGEVQAAYSIKTVKSSVGVSTFSYSGAYPVMDIKYTLVQGGTDIAALCTDPSIGWPDPYFEAIITLDPAGKVVAVEQPVKQTEAIKKAIEKLKK